jgi:hypothetical protein
VYAHQPDHPGVLHYLIHAYDDPEPAQLGLKAARAYAKSAAAVPHALHMPSHIFTRLGYWDESAATNLKGWNVSENDVKRAHESGAYREFHNLNYLEYAAFSSGVIAMPSTMWTSSRHSTMHCPTGQQPRTL